jgi:hypothetical protein
MSVNNNFSYSKNLLVFFSAIIFVLPTYLSIAGVTFINISFFALIMVFNGKIYTKLKLIEIFLPIILILIYINLHLLNNSSYNSLYKTVMINSILLLSILISISIEDINSFLKNTATIISFCGIFILLSVLFTDYSINTNNRLSFGIINPIWLGRFAGMAILILISQKRLRFAKLFYIINILIIVLSGSKGPIIGLLFVGIFHYLKSVKFILSIAIAVLLLFFSFSYFNEDLRLFITSRFLSLNPNATDLMQEIEDDRLSIIMRSTTNYVKSVDLSSFFFGLGPNQSSFYYYNSVINERWYPHNIFLEILFEYGFLALITFLFTLFKAQIWKKSMLNSLILFFLINSFFSGDLPLNWLLFLFISIKLIRKYV